MESDIIRPCGGTDIVDGAVRNEGRGRPGGIFEWVAWQEQAPVDTRLGGARGRGELEV